jgi:hypothetical protein
MKYRIKIEKCPACAIARCGRTVDAIEDFEVDKEKVEPCHQIKGCT